MRKTKIGWSLACLAATVAVPAAFAQEIIYDNSANFIGQRTSPQNAELGDIVTFAGSSRILTEFQFEYFGTSNFSGNETAQVFIRSVEGGVSPTSILYQTQPFSLLSGQNTVTLNGFNTVLPDTVAWTVRFAGFEGSEEAGLLFYNPPTTGSSPTYPNPQTGAATQFSILRNADGSFAVVDTPGVIDNLAARFTAVPEPSTWALMLGGLAGFGFLRRRKA